MPETAFTESFPGNRKETFADGFVDNYLLYLLARASNEVSGEFHNRLAELDVPVPEWRVLAVLHGRDGVTIGELAERCLFKQPTVTKVVDRLEHRGLVDRQSGTDDRRRVLVSLTPAGGTLVSDLIVEAKAHETRVLSTYSDDEAAALKANLRTVIERSRHLAN